MKTILMSLTALAFSASAFAELKYTARIDYQHRPEYTNTANVDIQQQQLFRAPFNRIFFASKTGDAEIRGSMNLWGSSVSGGPTTYSLYNFVDYFWIQKPFGDRFYVRLGRLINPGGGFEYDETNRGDQYQSTMANSGATSGGFGRLLTPDATITNTPPTVIGNPGGAAFGVKLGDDHTIEVHVTNESNTIAGTNQAVQQNEGIHYAGSFADKMVEAKVGYISGRADTSATAKVEQSHMNAGVKVNMFGGSLTLEHFNLKNDNKTGATETTDKTTSTYALIEYPIEQWKITPVFKYETSEGEIAESATANGSLERTAMTLAIECSPHADEDIRYHIAYSAVEDEYGLTTLTEKDTKGNIIYAGIKFSADLLK